jgi:putative RecB family exonuclease
MGVSIAQSPGEIALELTGRNYLSFSAISAYRACPLQFRFRYIDQLPEDTVSASLVFGSAIHSCFQFHFQELLAGNDAPDLDTLLAVYQDAWDRESKRIVRFARGEDINTLGKLAERVLVAFQHSPLAQPAGRLIGVEEDLRGSLVPGCPDLLARVDLIEDAETELVVTDFKTSRSSWSQGKADASAEQLLLYHELVQPLAAGKVVTLKFAVISKGKVPTIELHEVVVSRQRTERTKRIVESVWRGITMGSSIRLPQRLPARIARSPSLAGLGAAKWRCPGLARRAPGSGDLFLIVDTQTFAEQLLTPGVRRISQ